MTDNINIPIRTFGRRHGKRLSDRQQFLIDNILPSILPKNDENAGILEIGFGAGEHIRDLALAHPDDIIIGAEPFINGVASLLSSITDDSIKPEFKNIRIWPDDVRKILQNNFKFDEIYILHPDPWPKARHEKRRLLSAEFLNILSSHLLPDGKIIIGTDHWEYYDWILSQLEKTKLNIKTQDIDVIQTRYMEKNRAGTENPKYLVLSIS